MADPTMEQQTLTVQSGVPGLVLVHGLVWTAKNGLAVDGSWSVTMEAGNVATQRCRFRTLHAAMHYAQRLAPLADWTGDVRALLKTDEGQALKLALAHAEAHAHEVDAVYPPGNVIPSENGPSIVDHDGSTRRFMLNAPSIDWTAGAGSPRCTDCGDEPILWFDWMNS